MRPRRKCLGYSGRGGAEKRPRTASMRPRRKCLGYQFRGAMAQSSPARFNEAEA